MTTFSFEIQNLKVFQNSYSFFEFLDLIDTVGALGSFLKSSLNAQKRISSNCK